MTPVAPILSGHRGSWWSLYFIAGGSARTRELPGGPARVDPARQTTRLPGGEAATHVNLGNFYGGGVMSGAAMVGC
jgi:hypothetical protein